MNEWLDKLTRELADIPEEERKGILDYYAEMLSDRLEQGQSEEEALASFGSVREIAAGIREELACSAERDNMPPGYRETICDAPAAALSVLLRNNRVYLGPSPDDKVHLRYREFALCRYEVAEEGGSLLFRSKRRSVWGHIAATLTLADLRGHKPVYVLVPERFSGELSVCSDNGAVLCEGVARARRVRLDADNGRIALIGCEAEDGVELDSDNGRITVRDVRCGGKLSAHSDNGRIDISHTAAPSMRLHSGNGGVRLQRVESANVEVKTSNGRIEADLVGRQEDHRMELKTSNGVISVAGVKLLSQTLNEGGKRSFTARTGNGRITVVFTEPSVCDGK